MIGLDAGTMADHLGPLAPARLGPVLRWPNGTIVGETRPRAETLAERHPEAAMWPTAPAARATARWLCAEMASGFGPLRGDCPMQLSHIWEGFTPSEAVRADLARLDTLWTHARTFAAEGDWLFGPYSLADVFFAPVAARIVGYGLPVTPFVRDYAMRAIAHPSFEAWRADALNVTYDPFPYPQDLPQKPWPAGLR